MAQITLAPRVLPDLSALQAEIDRLRADNAALIAAKSKGLGFKVSEKGCVSVYGLGRFPVSLYRGQWTKLWEQKAALEAFIEANRLVIDAREGKE